MRWLVCGGRSFGDLQTPTNPVTRKQRVAEYEFAMEKLSDLICQRSIHYQENDNWLPTDIEIISGMALGADTIGVDFAAVNWLVLHAFPADWVKYGKQAGFVRNSQMLKEGKPDLVIAFPGGRGTAMMVELSQKAGVETVIVPYK